MSPVTADCRFDVLLEQFGPDASGAPLTVEEARKHCRKLALGHYENFPVLSIVLPRSLRQDFANVYAFCRWADDLSDEVCGSRESLKLLEWWQSELDECFAGRAQHPVFIALRETIERRALSKKPFDDLVDAFRQDQVKVEYETFEELQGYCRRSADPVGRIVLHLCGLSTEVNIVRSDQVCSGLQLINFWQDVARDYKIGRVYLPRNDRLRFGYSDDDLANRRTTRGFIELMRFQVERARDFLRSGLPLANDMPGRLKIVIGMFAFGGLRLCEKLEEIDYRVWDHRPTLNKFDATRVLTVAVKNALLPPKRRTCQS